MTNSTRKAPYTHHDGSNCWTKDCSRNVVVLSEKEIFFNQIKEKFKNVTHLNNNLPPLSAFMQAVEKRRVDCSRHPQHPYITFKYSRDTQFNYDWDDVTMAARGIIFNEETGEVVARPFAKFFNYNEPTAPTDKMVGRVEVTNKEDGSLGIGYENPDGTFAIATAGSFKSEQAKHATELYNERYDGKWNRNPKMTYLWEVVYPSNQIVVDYGEEDDLILIGAVNKRTGRSVPLSEIKEWKWKRAAKYEMTSLNEVVTSGERENAEGYIVHYVETDVRVKYKHQDYLRLHRVATGVTAKTIWKKMSSGEDMTEWKKEIPEEFLEFINTRQNTIQKDFDAKVAEIRGKHAAYQATLPKGYDRKTFAVTLNGVTDLSKAEKGYILNIENSGRVFNNHVQANKLWDSVKPKDETTAWNMNYNPTGGR